MFNATSRLAEGRPAVDTVQEHVWACHLLGYQDPDLTLHGSQVRDWYGSEDGIDLHALDADCDALRAAAAATEAALVRQDAQLASMSAAWHGAGAEASREFLRRHGEASAVRGGCGADSRRIARCLAGYVVAQHRREGRRDDGGRRPRRTARLVGCSADGHDRSG